MGSKVIKIDNQTVKKLENRHHFSDIDMFKFHDVYYKVESDGSKTKYFDDLPMAYDVDAVRQSVKNILMWHVGENILRPEFGHEIHKSMYEQLTDTNKGKVAEEIRRAISDNEPRVSDLSVSIKNSDENDENNTLEVQVTFKVVGNKVEDAKFTEQATINGK